jgi:hypothetical protein
MDRNGGTDNNRGACRLWKGKGGWRERINGDPYFANLAPFFALCNLGPKSLRLREDGDKKTKTKTKNDV